MPTRRTWMRMTAAGLLLWNGRIKRVLAQQLAPMLGESEPKALSIKYKAVSKDANSCAKCQYYTDLPSARGTGTCWYVDNRRVSAGGVCVYFKPR